MVLFRFLIALLCLAGLTSCSKQQSAVGLVEMSDSARMEFYKTARIGVMLGSTQDVMVTEKYPNAEILRADDPTTIDLMVETGKCDAYFNEEIQAIMRTRGNEKLYIISTPLDVSEVGMAFRKDDAELCQQFNEYLKIIEKNGLLQEMYDRWKNDDGTQMLPDIEVPTEGKPLRVGTAGVLVYFNSVRNGELIGLDIEITKRFAAHIGRPIEYSKINFSGLIVALVSGKIDMIASDMNITPERSKSVRFSDPYYYSNTIAIVRSGTQEGGTQGFIQTIKDSFYNNLVKDDRYKLILDGLKVTLIISFFATILGTIFGAVVCWMRMNKRKFLRDCAAVYISLMRGTPVLVFLMLLYYVVFADWDISATFVAILAFSFNLAAYVSEMFRTSIEGVDHGQTEAGIALGFTPIQTFAYIVLPQATRSVLPVYKGEIISMIKMTSVVGYIAVEDLTKASDIVRSQTFDAFFPLIIVAVIYFVLAWLFTRLLDSIGGRDKNKA